MEHVVTAHDLVHHILDETPNPFSTEAPRGVRSVADVVNWLYSTFPQGLLWPHNVPVKAPPAPVPVDEDTVVSAIKARYGDDAAPETYIGALQDIYPSGIVWNDVEWQDDEPPPEEPDVLSVDQLFETIANFGYSEGVAMSIADNLWRRFPDGIEWSIKPARSVSKTGPRAFLTPEQVERQEPILLGDSDEEPAFTDSGMQLLDPEPPVVDEQLLERTISAFLGAKDPGIHSFLQALHECFPTGLVWDGPSTTWDGPVGSVEHEPLDAEELAAMDHHAEETMRRQALEQYVFVTDQPKRWEYTTHIGIMDDISMSLKGSEGWELVNIAVDHGLFRYVFKRPVRSWVETD